MNRNTACFFGHREIENKNELKEKIKQQIEALIVNEEIYIFLFGSKSAFDDLCYLATTELKQKYPHIQRVYVRAEYPYISEHYKNYLLESYEDTYYPQKILNSGRASYVERNYEMIDKSCVCVVYYNSEYAPKSRKSGTQIAYNYALKNKKKIINTFN
ncbi:MAG: hypothetical protein IJO86_00190 [Oscillospiraceae bacterium]|nr:hypothetical protein [Oscillospiraceae bacterium]